MDGIQRVEDRGGQFSFYFAFKKNQSDLSRVNFEGFNDVSFQVFANCLFREGYEVFLK